MNFSEYPFRAEPIAALDHVRLVENGEPLVDVAEYCPNIIIHEHCVPLVRLTVAKMLQQADSALPDGLHLWIKTGLRSLERQRRSWEGHYADLKRRNPQWPEHTLRRQTNKFLAPLDHPAPPGHSTGGAVDVFLMRPDHVIVDMGFDLHNLKSIATTYPHPNPAVCEAREQLFDVMTDAGFSNCRDEFWHYSYGDAGWAVRHGLTECCYGLTDLAKLPDAELYAMIANRNMRP
ncbi:MAG: M15 family metallopeptidase [Armatimonadota bacterium]